MFIGRLYNSGVKLSVLRQRFGHDPRTVKRWSTGLKICDVNEMAKAFTGRKAQKKIIPELIRYVIQQYRSRSLFGRSFRKKIIMGVREIFGITISASLIRGIYKNIDDKIPGDSSNSNDENSVILPIDDEKTSADSLDHCETRMDILEHNRSVLNSKH